MKSPGNTNSVRIGLLWVIYDMQNLFCIFDAPAEKQDLRNGKKRVICSVPTVLQHLSTTAAMTNPRWNELEGGHEGCSNFKWRGKIVFIHIDINTNIHLCSQKNPRIDLVFRILNSIKLPAIAVKRKKSGLTKKRFTYCIELNELVDVDMTSRCNPTRVENWGCYSVWTLEKTKSVFSENLNVKARSSKPQIRQHCPSPQI